MKAKKIFMFALILIMPCLVLFGCDQPASYNINVYANCTNGTVNGQGTYVEGETVTLSANGINGNKFIAWVYQNKKILENDSTYTITTSEDNMSSTLSFTSSQTTADRYTAVFQDNKQIYYTLDSYKFTTSASQEEPLPEDAETLFSGILSVSFGETNSSYREVFNAETEFKDNVTVKAENVKDVMMLSRTSPYYLRFSIDNGSGNVQIKTIPVTYNSNSQANDVSATFNSDRTVTVSYTFEIAQAQMVEPDANENEEPLTTKVTILINLTPLSI